MRIRTLLNKTGVTLVELLVVLVIFAVVVAGIYRVFVAQTKAYTIQDQVVEVQQNIRSAMEILLRDVRMAGYDNDNPDSTITIANPIIPADHSVTVNYEFNNTQRCETIYSVTVGTTGGILRRQVTMYPNTGGPIGGSTTDGLLENVAALDLTYGVDTDNDGSVNSWVSAGSVGTAKVIALKVSLVARPDQTNPDVQKMVSPRALESTVTLRNRCLIKF
jgi:type IV pilus assembly protein PilW